MAIVILTAVIGTWMMKRQGLKTLFRLQGQLNQSQLPLREVFEGFCLLIAGALLLTPGFVTDGAGFLLFMPPIRNLLRIRIGRIVAARGNFYGPRTDKTADVREPFGKGMEVNEVGPVIDGEFQDLTGQDKTEIPETGPDSVVRRIDK